MDDVRSWRPDVSSTVKQAIIYQVKILKSRIEELQAEATIKLRIMDILLKILLPLSFIALKLMGSFIDFMLALGLVNFCDDRPEGEIPRLVGKI